MTKINTFFIYSILIHILLLPSFIWSDFFFKKIFSPEDHATTKDFIPIDFIKNKKETLVDLKKIKQVGKKKSLHENNNIPLPLQDKPRLAQAEKKSELLSDNHKIIKQYVDLNGLLEASQTKNGRFIDQVGLPQNAGINFNFEVPAGFELDELNPLEFKFYIFNRRFMSTVGTALYKSVEKFNFDHPRFNFIEIGAQTMTARVLFLPSGKIDQVTYMDRADNEKMQVLFQDFIERVYLPNPPQELLINGKLWVYYKLLLNQQNYQ